MKKRVLSIFLALVMVLGTLPISALAADGTGTEPDAPETTTQTDTGAVQIRKEVTHHEDGTYSLSVEAYVTNDVTVTDKRQALDIVLVLDVSGSMRDKITSYTYTATEKSSWSYRDISNSRTDYYYKADDGNYYPVQAGQSWNWDNRSYSYYLYYETGSGWFSKEEHVIGSTSTGESTTLYNGVLYTRSQSTENKMTSMQNAVKGFIGQVADDASENNVTHQISIVKFAGEKKDTSGNDFYNNNTYNYSQIVTNLTDVSGSGANTLKSQVDALKPGGATQVNFGLAHAQTVLANARTDAQKVVVVFTDGEPTSGNSFESSVAANAINTAKTLKDNKAKVYTIGVFENANPADTTGNFNKYMNAVSSNYPTATVTNTNNFNVTLGDRATGNYYFAATDAEDLSSAFSTIASEAASLAITAGTDSVLSDTLSGAFKFDEVDTETNKIAGLTVQKVPVIGFENGAYTWGTAQTVDNVNVTVQEKNIRITGFDYTDPANCVTTKTDQNGEKTYSGYKLVVTFNIVPDPTYENWDAGTDYYDTNSTGGASLTYKEGEEDKEATQDLKNSPEIDVAVYTLSYDNNDGSGSIAAQDYLAGTPVPVSDNKQVNEEGEETAIFTREEATLLGFTTTKVDGVVTTSTEASNISLITQVTVNANTTLYAVWAEDVNGNDIPDYEETKYSITYAPGADDNTVTGLPGKEEGILSGIQKSVSAAEPTRSGYDFVCWSTSDIDTEDGQPQEKTYSSNESFIMPAKNVTFTARWKEQDPQPTPAVKEITKEVVEIATSVPTGITGIENVAYPMNGTITLPAGTTSVTLLYKVTVTGDAGARYDVTDFGATCVSDNASGTIPDNGSVVLYFTRTFSGLNAGKNTCTNTATAGTNLSDSDTTTVTVENPTVPEEKQLIVQFNAGEGEWKIATDPTSFTLSSLEPNNQITAPAVTAPEGKEFDCWKSSTKTGNTEFKSAYTDYGTLADYDVTVNTDGVDVVTWTAVYKDAAPDVPVEPALTVTKTANKTRADVGDTIIWTITVTNNGEDTLSSVTVKDVLDAAGSISVGKLPSNVTYNADESTFTITSLEAGKSAEIEVSYKVRSKDAGKTISNTAVIIEVDGEDPDPDIEDDTSTVRVWDDEPDPVASLRVKKTVDNDTPKVGDTIEYTVTVINDGDVDLYDVTVTDDLDAAGSITVDEDDLPRRVTYNEKRGTFTISWLDKGERLSFTYTYTVLRADAGDTLTNKVTVESRDADDSDSTTVQVKKSTPSLPGIVRPSLNTQDHAAYIIGYVDGTVRPLNDISRSEVATIFFRLLTDESRALYWSQTNDYSDVDAGDWFNNAVSTLSNAGIITGYLDGTFRPNAPITRSEFAAIAARFSDVVYNGGNSFSDVPASHWAARYIALAEHLGWVTGYLDGTFKPEQNITRAEAITMINRVLDRAVAEGSLLSNMVTWSDNLPGTWYYEAVQEATNSHKYVRTFIPVPGQDFNYENWQTILTVPDWAALERAWSTANSKS